MKQLIFVVETNKKILSDDRYINRLIKDRYDLSSNEIKIQFVHMNTKTRYNHKSVLNDIKSFIIN